MRYRTIDNLLVKHPRKYSVRMLTRVLDVSTSGYYVYLKRKKRQDEPLKYVWPRVQSQTRLLEQIRRVHRDSLERYGSPRITAELKRRGVPCSENRVARLMQRHGIRAKHRKPFRVTTIVAPGNTYPENLVRRKFRVDAPNTVWVSDITYIHTKEGWLYLAAVLDLFSRKVVGWSMRYTLDQHLTCQALLQAVHRRNPPQGLILHSDRGFHYRTDRYRKIVERYGFRQSVSAKGNCYDNAHMESFFKTLKAELVQGRSYRTRLDARTQIFMYIEGFYNKTRLHSTIGYQSPESFERSLVSVSL
jgi:putative transposase